jgi:alkylhydroperoxidase/carboxymuconolactone decarboxylase family protein YurZ
MATSRLDVKLIEEQMGTYSDTTTPLKERADGYRDMIGYLPPRVEARLHVTGALDPTMLDLQEKVRTHAFETEFFDDKQVQLVIFGMLMAELSDAATIHGVAARRAGASWGELQAIVNLAYIFRGVSAANRGAEILVKIAERENEKA